MKFAPIAPPHLLDVVVPMSGYHLALGQEMLKDKKYAYTYRTLAKQSNFIIIDNGAAESDTPPFEKILDLAESIGADEVVMPDVLKDYNETLKLAAKWVRKLPMRRVMVVPQGKTVNEWIDCAVEIFKMTTDMASIGVPKHLDDLPNGRTRALIGLKGVMVTRRIRVPIHLLGVNSHLFTEIYRAAKVMPIRGIDSGAPVAQAQHGNIIATIAQQRQSLSWEADADHELVRANIAAAMFWAYHSSWSRSWNQD